MADSLRTHIANVLAKVCDEKCEGSDPFHMDEADALLADPTLAAIFDLAAWGQEYDLKEWIPKQPELSPEVRALLAAWRAER